MSKLNKLTMSVSAASLVLFTGLLHAQEGFPVGEGYLGNTLPIYPGGISGGFNEQLYPYDSQTIWQHGHFQEIPAYGGHVSFRPYNYKDVLSQAQTAAGWGERANMPYSQQFWHRYSEQARMERIAPREGVKAANGAAGATNPYQSPSNQALTQPYGAQPYGAQPYGTQLPGYQTPRTMQPTPANPQPYASPTPANPVTPPPPAAGYSGNYRSATFQVPMSTSKTQPLLTQPQVSNQPIGLPGTTHASTVQQVQHLRQQLHQLETQMSREIESGPQSIPVAPHVRFPASAIAQ